MSLALEVCVASIFRVTGVSGNRALRAVQPRAELTSSLSARLPRSTCCMRDTPTAVLEIEAMLIMVSLVIGTPSAMCAHPYAEDQTICPCLTITA